MVYETMTRLLGGGDNGEDGFGVHISYTDIYACAVFLSAVYASGVFSSKVLKMPSLVGEIFTGILLGPNLGNVVPNPEAFVMLGELGLLLLVLEAGIDIDLTNLKLVGARGVMIAFVGTFLPVVLAFLAAILLGYRGVAAIAAGCSFAPTSLGIAMNILRQSGLVNTPVGQLIVAAAIIDDMIALVILSQLQAFVGDADIISMLIPIFSAVGFLLIGGYLAVFVLPRVLDRFVLSKISPEAGLTREWVALAAMFTLLLTLVPATYYAKASPLMGAFLAGLAFCSDHSVHHMFESQFKRVMQWLMRIFFAASIGFQVPIRSFGSSSVLLQGLALSSALLGKVLVGFMAPNFSLKERFRSLHLRDCLVVGLSMAAEGEFAFVIAVFAVSNNMISQELYASVVVAVLLSTIVAPFLLRYTISYFDKEIEQTLAGASEDPNSLLEKGIREGTTVFFCVQTKSKPAWGIQSDLVQALSSLHLDIIDHRSWHPRHSTNLLVNEVYVKDKEVLSAMPKLDREKMINERANDISNALSAVIGQDDAVVKTQQWNPILPDDGSVSDSTVSERIVHATVAALEESRRQTDREGNYVMLEEDKKTKRGSFQHVEHLDVRSTGMLEGIFRRDRKRKTKALHFTEGVELLSQETATGYVS